MQTTELKLAKIGNSRGVRLPARVLSKYGFGDTLLMEESVDGILLRPIPSSPPKLSWRDTAQAMASEEEDWSEWDATASDGLENIVWQNAKVAER